ncbi:unnamed protein product, partial [Auanema sp. JU1783]
TFWNKMQLFISLTDNEEVVHDEFPLVLDEQSLLSELEEQVASILYIKSENLDLFFADGRRIFDFDANSQLAQIGLHHLDKVIAKHSKLSIWTALLNCEEAFGRSHGDELRKSIHLDAKGLIDVLVRSLFFVAYPSLGTRRFAIEKKFYTYFNRGVQEIRSSCRSHFTKVYGEKCNVTFGSREDGSRAGCLCLVDDGATICRFFVKTHHGAGDRSSYTRLDIDIKELFIYTFLEALRMGAEIQFINNESFSKRIIYIASREIPSFQTLKFLELTEPEALQRYSKSVVEMLSVYSILMLADHHTANMGFNSALNPFILDFIITGKRLNDVRDIHDGVRMSKQINAILGTLDERIKISKEFLIRSNFSSVFERSIVFFLDHHKPKFDKTKLVFDRINKTDDLLQYFDDVRKNISLFVDE